MDSQTYDYDGGGDGGGIDDNDKIAFNYGFDSILIIR